MSEANIKRGEKWSRVRELAVFQKRDKDVDWFDSQKSIVDDIKEYKESLNHVKETKSKGKK